MALWSQELNERRGTEVTEDQLRTARNNGYLSHMIFAMIQQDTVSNRLNFKIWKK